MYNPRAPAWGTPQRSDMTTIDYCLLAILVISSTIGLFRGLLREAISLATWIAAIWFAWHFGPALEPGLGGVLQDSPARPWAARAIIFVAVLLVGTLIGWLLSQVTRLSLFSGLDRLLGFFFGLLRGFVIVGVLVILGHALEMDREDFWKQAKLRPFAEGTANTLRSLVGEQHVDRVLKELG